MIAEFTVDGTEELKRWIMSFGKHAMILEPDDLRNQVLEEMKEAAAAQERYSAQKGRNGRRKRILSTGAEITKKNKDACDASPLSST